MTKKNIFVAAFVILLAAASLYFNRGRFAKEPLDISHRSIAPRNATQRGQAAKAPTKPIVFLFNKTVQLKSLKVVLVSDAMTNKYPHAIWNLITDSNSVPIKEFLYGGGIGGMKPAVKGVGADRLEPGVNYRLIVEAGPEKVQHDFTPVPKGQ
jgi:hypothetical protein